MTDLVREYLELRNKHDNEFFLATGGNGNQVERDKKKKEYEIPLLHKMSEEEFMEILKRADGLGEKMWLSNLKRELFT